MLLTAEQLAHVCTTLGGQERVALYIEPLNKWMARFEINTPHRIGAFVSQIMVETAELIAKRENLHYTTPAVLLKTFHNEVHDLADAAALIAKGAVAIGNRVYAHRNGNGDEASGDGYNFRGGGAGDLTGRTEYLRAQEALNIPLIDHPELIEQPDAAVATFALFWHDNHINELADAGNLHGVRARVNGEACEGLDRTLVYFGKYQAAVGAA